MAKEYRMPFPGWPIVVLIFVLLPTLIVNHAISFIMGRPERSTTPAKVTPPPPQQPVGSEILKNYGKAIQSPQQDLSDMHHTLGNFSLLVKGTNPIPLGANEDIANALRGRNSAKLRFLPDDAPCFNTQGQLVDRWQSPLFFHANDLQRVDIRSAGPDRRMWTADDIHRRYDGQFIKGAALNAPSLFEATKDYRPDSATPGP